MRNYLRRNESKANLLVQLTQSAPTGRVSPVDSKSRAEGPVENIESRSLVPERPALPENHSLRASCEALLYPFHARHRKLQVEVPYHQ